MKDKFFQRERAVAGRIAFRDTGDGQAAFEWVAGCGRLLHDAGGKAPGGWPSVPAQRLAVQIAVKQLREGLRRLTVAGSVQEEDLVLFLDATGVRFIMESYDNVRSVVFRRAFAAYATTLNTLHADRHPAVKEWGDKMVLGFPAFDAWEAVDSFI